MKKLLAIVSIVIIILAGTTAYQLSKKDKYNLVLEIDKDKPLKESLSILPVSNNPFFKLCTINGPKIVVIIRANTTHHHCCDIGKLFC